MRQFEVLTEHNPYFFLLHQLPDTGSEYEGIGGDVTDAYEFVLENFKEVRVGWTRIEGIAPSSTMMIRRLRGSAEDAFTYPLTQPFPRLASLVADEPPLG